jgi:hypothetical protein
MSSEQQESIDIGRTIKRKFNNFLEKQNQEEEFHRKRTPGFASLDAAQRFNKINHLHQQLPKEDFVAQLNDTELQELYQSLLLSLRHAETLCKNHVADLQNFYATQQYYEAQALQVKSYLEFLKTTQDREFFGFLQRMQTRIQQFNTTFKEAQRGGNLMKVQELVFDPPQIEEKQHKENPIEIFQLPLSSSSSSSEDQNYFLTQNAPPCSEEENDDKAVDFSFLDSIEASLCSEQEKENSSKLNPAITNQNASSDAAVIATIQENSLEIKEKTIQETFESLHIGEKEFEPSLKDFVVPKQFGFIDAAEFQTKIMKYFPFTLPLRIQGLTMDGLHLIECLIVQINEIDQHYNFTVKLIFAGKYRAPVSEPVMFPSLVQAWTVASRLCAENANLLGSSTKAHSAFRLVDFEHKHIPYSLQYLEILYNRFKEYVKKNGEIVLVPFMTTLHEPIGKKKPKKSKQNNAAQEEQIKTVYPKQWLERFSWLSSETDDI